MTEKIGDFSRQEGKKVQSDNIATAKVLADIVKTTLGPKGMDKLLMDQNGHLTITNDGYTILNELNISHPAGRLISEISKTQEKEIGDGTTSAVMIAGKLLDKADVLINKGIHPTTICKGYDMASNEAKKVISELEIVGVEDSLEQIAMTAMTGKAAEGSRELLAELIVKAVKSVADEKVDPERIKLQNVTGSTMEQSEIVEGIVLETMISHEAMPRTIKNPKIALLDCGLEITPPEMETMAQITNPEQRDAFLDSDDSKLREMVKKIIESKANVVITQKGYNDVVLNYLAKSGVIALRRINKFDMNHLAQSTGARVVQDIKDLTEEDLGTAGIIREVRNKEDSLIYIEDCKNAKAVTLVIHGSTEHIVEEIERAVTDGIGDVITTFNGGGIVPGGGAIEVMISNKIKEFAKQKSGRERLAIECFAESLEFIPETLSENAGLDPINTLTEIKAQQESGVNAGINIFTEKVEDTLKAGIIEPSKIKTQAINSATEVAIMILRIDDILIAKTPEQ